MRKEKIIGICMILILIAVLFNTISVLGEQTPDSPINITVINSTRKEAAPSQAIDAIAGNITYLSLSGESVTQTWQGYVGNISGKITLTNSENSTLYDWDLANPEGEIYVSRSPIDFSYGNVECYNMSEYHLGTYFILSEFETWLGVDSDSSDGVNETFNTTTDYNHFYAGTNRIDGECPLVNLYNSSGEKTDGIFEEVLLYNDASQEVIYTALLDREPRIGYDGNYWDFQMIVGENGHQGNTDATTYYFYVELQ